MAFSINKALKFMERKLNSEWSKITFEYELEDDEASATANITLNNHDDDIRVILTVYPSSMCNFRAVFDKLDKTNRSLDLVNTFNDNSLFFKAYIREDSYLEIDHTFFCYNEADLEDYSNEFMYKLANLADNETLQAITKMTY